MPITTIDQSDPYLQRYGSLTVSDDLAAQLAQQQQNANMMGFDAFNGVQLPQAGDNLLEFLANVHFSGQPQLASQLAQMNGIPQQDFTGLIQTVNDATAKSAPWLTEKIGGVGNYAAEHPAVLLAPAAIAGALGALGVGGGAGGAVGAAEAGGAAGGGTIAGALPAGYSGLASIPGIADMVVTGALPGLGLGGSLGLGLGGAAALGGLGAGGATAAPAAGYSGLDTMPGAADMTVTGAAPGMGLGGALGAGLGGAAGLAALAGGASPADMAAGFAGNPAPEAPVSNFPTDVPDIMTVTGQQPGLGAGGLTGIGLGGAAGAAALLGGGSGAAVVPQGPPEPPQGPPEQPGAGAAAGTGAGAGAAAGAGSAAGGLAGIGWPGWAALAASLASGLTAPDAITSSRTNDPPAYLAPYLSEAAGAAQHSFQAGPYIAPVQQAASDYGTNVLTGSYLNANPYLDATFHRAAGAVTNEVQSNFGRSGRNVGGPDAAGLATDKYSDLANMIYGGNYQAERDRMQQIVPQANQLGAATDPNRSLDDYIARLRNLGSGYGTSSSSTPTSTDWLGGLAGLGLLLAGGH